MRGKLLLSVLLLTFLLPASVAAGQDARPGQTPPPAQLELRMNSEFVFPSAFSTCRAGIENPVENGLPLRYALSLSRGELLRVGGLRLPGEEEILLYVSGSVAPGEKIERVRLNPLPDGRLLPEGVYRAVMTVRPATGQAIGSEFAVQVMLRVMVSGLRAQADSEGLVSLKAYNGGDVPARFGLAISAEALEEPHGVDTLAFGTENSFASLALSGVLAPGQEEALRLCRLPDGSALPPGSYEAWLLRFQDGAEPVVTAKVQLEVPEAERSWEERPGCPPLLPAPPRSLAQAVVNARYLLEQP